MKKMIKALLVMMCCGILVSSCAGPSVSDEGIPASALSGIEFEKGSWAEIIKKAKEEHKLVFVDFYTQWCGPCYTMATTVFTEPVVGVFYNRHFINAKIDAENGEGVSLAKKYGVRSYPTFLFIDPSTETVVHQSGSRQSDDQFLFTGRSATQPELRSFYLNDEYKKGNRDKQFLMDYIRFQHSVYNTKAALTAFDELIGGGASLEEKEVWDVFVEAVPRISSYLKDVSAQYEKYCSLYGKEAVDEKFSKETKYGDISEIESLCDFADKKINLEFIRISNALYKKSDYDEAITRIDALIADPDMDKQQVIEQLKFIVRLDPDVSRMPEKWFDKCVEYLRYIAYNNKDRKDPSPYFSYAEALEKVIQRTQERKAVPASLLKAPTSGKQEFSMRPDDLKRKPSRKK